MNGKDQSLGKWIMRRYRTTSAQGMVEFALALPILLLLTFGIVEFGRLLQAWLALENGARFAVRYAVTGEYNVDYCDEAGVALGLTAEDGDADCKVFPAVNATDDEKEEAREQTQALQDWARLPSIRDAALGAAAGISYDGSVSGDYMQYLTDAETNGSTFSSSNRGDPSKPGFFYISVCSNRRVPAPTGSGVAENNQRFYISDSAMNPQFLAGFSGSDDHLFFPSTCQLYDPIAMYMDDAGGPGDRVRVTLTYRHDMIMPLLSEWWPTLRLNTSRDGVVEKFRTSRVTGLSEGNMNPDTATFTPTETSTSTATSTATMTSTATATPTATQTLVQCVTGGNGIRAEYYAFTGSAPPANPFTSPLTVGIVDNVNFNWGSGSPVGIPANLFAARYVGQVMPLHTETYTFYANSDDGSRLWVDGVRLVNQWSNQSATERSGAITLNRCQKYDIVLEYFENSGSAVMQMSWSSPSQAKQIIPKVVLFSNLGTVSTATITNTPTITRTGTITLTSTITATPTQTFTVTQTVPSPTRTVTRTATITRTMTLTVPSPTNTNTLTSTSTSTATSTATATSTRTETPLPPTITNTPNIPSSTPSRTPTRSGGG